jgi:phosphate transport system protein
MSVHLEKAIRQLKKKILALGTRVEEGLRVAVDSLENRDINLATQVVDGDNAIDDMEVEVEEDCLKILALYQPVASDLRFIVACLKINNDLERVGDLAVNIAERAAFLAGQEPVDVAFDFRTMSTKTQWMLKSSLDALVNRDAELAWTVITADDEVDAMNRQMYVQSQDGIRADIDALESIVHTLSVSRHLERIGDLATNIAEDVIYMVEGQIVRHHIEEYRSRADEESGPDSN